MITLTFLPVKALAPGQIVVLLFLAFLTIFIFLLFLCFFLCLFLCSCFLRGNFLRSCLLPHLNFLSSGHRDNDLHPVIIFLYKFLFLLLAQFFFELFC